MEKWFNKTASEVEEYLQTNMEKGLSSVEVKKRQEETGFNELKQAKKKSLFVKFLEQFKDFMIIVLIIAAIVSGIVGSSSVMSILSSNSTHASYRCGIK